jgi:uncharacterized protein (TIGR03067 family)
MYSSLVLGVALAVAAPGVKDPPKKEVPTLVGEWVGETGVAGGKPKPPPAGTTMTFTADGKMVLAERGHPERNKEGTYTADPKKTPGELDLVPVGPGPGKEEKLAGIYKIEGDTLTICFAMDGKRPTEFASPDGSAVMLITLKRAKKE